MDNLHFYLLIFLRRLPWFVAMSTVMTAISVTIAFTLPPAYVSQMQVIVESPQIPEELAPSTVRTPPLEQLQVLQQKLLTRNNLLDIARKLDVLIDIEDMNPDQIVDAMRARTEFEVPRGRHPIPLMTVRFEAPTPRKAAAVLNEYLNLIQQQDAEFRRGRAGETLEFFIQETERLGNELDAQSAGILKFKQANADALPDSLEFRLSQQALMQERNNTLEREIKTLQNQRGRLVELFEQTGKIARPGNARGALSPDQQRLANLQSELDEALVVYSPENPRVQLLRARIEQLEERISAASPTLDQSQPGDEASDNAMPSMLDVQLAEIDSRIEALSQELETVNTQLETLTDSIARTTEITIALEELERKYTITQNQYDQAEDRLSMAKTGERIEARSRGQRISVIEHPAVPSEPTKPNRLLIAGGGTAFGIILGLALIVLLETLNNTARRPEDLVNRFGISPFTTIPYIPTRGQTFRQRSLKVLLILAILTGIPAAIYALHIYYLPLDLLADRLMNKIGVRW